MRRRLFGSLELDDDRSRIDADAVHRFLSEESYWARGCSREAVARTIRDAARVVGLYDGVRQIGFARILSDGAAISHLCDVYVLPAYRGRGLGVELVREAVDNGPYAGFTWTLKTKDAHGLYERFGFHAPNEGLMERRASR